MSDPPGGAGLPVIGDKSYEFYRDPVEFIRREMAKHGPIYLTRLLMKPTVIVASYESVRAALTGKYITCSCLNLHRFIQLYFIEQSCPIRSPGATRDSSTNLKWPHPFENIAKHYETL